MRDKSVKASNQAARLKETVMSKENVCVLKRYYDQ